MITSVPPAAIFIIGAFLIPFLKGKLKTAYLLLLPIIAIINLLNLSEGTSWIVGFLDYNLIFCRVDKLSMVFGYIFVIMGFLGTLYGIHVKEGGHHLAVFLYVGSSLGVVFSGDLFSLFIFWEIMAFASTFLIWYKKDKRALKAGLRYLLVHTFGGTCLLAGIMMYLYTTGSLEFSFIGINGIASRLIFLGFIINAAIPPLHAWLPDAYPESTVTGTVILSIFTTKTAVYVLARAFPGTEILIFLGAIMTVFPIFYAVIENDTRRVLAYSLIEQVGFMIVGIGIGTELSLNGAVSHAFCNILFEGLLFMCTGAVLYVTGTSKCTELGGLYRTMPITLMLCLVGAASISAFPLFTGFVSKSMVIQAAADGHMFIIWLALLFASAGVFHYAGIKIPYFIFFAEDSGKRPDEPPFNMLLSMGIVAFLCILIGIFPGVLYRILPYPVDFVPYTSGHVLSQLQLLFFAGLAFLFLITYGFYPKEERSTNLDTDWFYRKAGRGFMWFCNHPAAKFNMWIDQAFLKGARGFIWFCRNPIPTLGLWMDTAFVMFYNGFIWFSENPVSILVSGFYGGLHLAFAMVSKGLLKISSAIEKARDRAEKQRVFYKELIEHGPPGGDARSISSDLFIAFIVFAVFLVYLAIRYFL
ncbi:MAG: Na(+)/H(+) antiporter subunit D [Methanocellales archaeon]|nr:Na(+)/H(+) antiporter subunit D [Methanocellales archaeon]MDD3290912.1 Na(+)/H(+) antiporter subunit D [Methanocellales archaeon]MDD5234797.1 Na(+)/H(+) antiporter subunit D [Methanocellales archaeon]MDD5484833.1 Na(+)/H(+) antiporter subunit D [Methanocellales archaeon]